MQDARERGDSGFSIGLRTDLSFSADYSTPSTVQTLNLVVWSYNVVHGARAAYSWCTFVVHGPSTFLCLHPIVLRSNWDHLTAEILFGEKNSFKT